MRETKTSHRFYFAWEFDLEVADLNQASLEGWQLTKGGCFHSVFTRDSSQIYRYALDFNNHIPDMMTYRQMFADQGWEYISSTFNGWHYFRKPYDPAIPPEEYEIYTDRASLREMLQRWKRLCLGLVAIWLVLTLCNTALLINRFTPSGACSIGLGICVLLLFSYGFQQTRRILEGRPPRSRRFSRGLSWLLLALMVLFLVMPFVWA